MVTLHEGKQFIINNDHIASAEEAAKLSEEAAKKETLTWQVLSKHNHSDNMEHLEIQFDSMGVYDNTYVGILQTAYASGLKEFPMPCVFTNCHNCLCAVGGTINTDVHKYAESACRKSGGIFVPPHEAVIHQYMREMIVNSGDMSIVSDSHTRYGALGTMAMGEGGPELVKQLLSKTYDIAMPGVIAIYMTGAPQPGVGPQDIALAIIGAVFANGYVKNKVMEFVGPGVSSLSADYRIGVDVMTTETTCLSSIWRTDEKISEFYQIHGRSADYKELNPGAVAYYDGVVKVELDKIKPMIAMPFHPSNVYTIEELKANLDDILSDVEKKAAISLDGKVPFTLKNKVHDGKLLVDQGIIAGCAGGGFENICDAADILKDHSIGDDAFTLSVYPASTPIYMELARNGKLADLLETGAIVKTAFCGPCFGAGDTPANNAFSIRHSTRNFPNREGSKIQNGQISSVALMDARSIAATAANKGFLTAADEFTGTYTKPAYHFDKKIYENRVFDSKGVADPSVEIQFGPNIKDWPAMPQLAENLILKVVSEIHDPVTTTDELIPSGETSSYRSNPLKLASFALSRRDPDYVPRARATQALEEARRSGAMPPELQSVQKALSIPNMGRVQIGSVLFANKPGDGSAREQAASCQRVLGGCANLCYEFATKRYRSNCVNWGMLPFTLAEGANFPGRPGDFLYVPQVREKVTRGDEEFPALLLTDSGIHALTLYLKNTTAEERELLLTGCLMNHYAAQNAAENRR